MTKQTAKRRVVLPQRKRASLVRRKTGVRKAVSKVAIVISLFNEAITKNLLTACLKTLEENGYRRDQIDVFKVPGAFEIGFLAQKVALSGAYVGVVTLGCVIRGETAHFEYVSLSATLGSLLAGMNTGCPVLFGVITTENLEQALERSQPNEFNKGREVALALLDTLETLKTIPM